MKYIITCNDVIKAMERDNIAVEADDIESAVIKAKTKFARKYKTKKDFVSATAIHKIS